MARNVTIKVKGIQCEGCENTIRTALGKVAGVVTVKADHRTALVDVVLQGDDAEPAVKDRLRDLGYEPVG